MGCSVCDDNARLGSLPPRELIAADRYWRAAHAFGTGTPGWLVLMPLRHVTAVAELTDAEAAVLGEWQVRLSRALHAVTGCVKTYVAQFAEAEGFAHVHFHIIARMDDLPEERRGPRVFTMLGRSEEHDLNITRRDEIAVEVRRYLEARGWPVTSPFRRSRI
ncbi:HIT family protein [Actinomadura rugatobispora]|uniref:HIT family protein n=1 Tax=Actinomadura rugatobispora TaxID=1994 RepID=A0ABW0ZNP5_9ACTN